MARGREVKLKRMHYAATSLQITTGEDQQRNNLLFLHTALTVFIPLWPPASVTAFTNF